jgi:hypothetical protein
MSRSFLIEFRQNSGDDISYISSIPNFPLCTVELFLVIFLFVVKLIANILKFYHACTRGNILSQESEHDYKLVCQICSSKK